MKFSRNIIVLFFALFTFKPLFASDDVLDAVQVVGGIYAGTLIHELGHAATAKLNGGEILSIDVPREGTLFSGSTKMNLPKDLSSQSKQLIAVSGLLVASLAGELVIQTDGLHSNPFASGVVSSVQASNFIHVATYYMGGSNDITSFEDSGGNAHLLSALLVGYSLYTLDRMDDKGIPLFGVSFNF